MMRGLHLIVSFSLMILLAGGCKNPPFSDSGDKQYSAIQGVCCYSVSGGPFVTGKPFPKEGIKIIVRDSSGRKKIKKAISGKDGKFEIPVSPGKYQV